MIPARLRLLVWCALVLVAVALGYAAWIWRPTKAPPDMIAVLRANNRGVGHMERFEDTEYPAAEAAFREAVSLAPDWLPGQINLGISLLNQHERPAKIDEAAALFEKVLKKDPENPYAHHCLGIIFEHRTHFEQAFPHFQKVTEIDPGDPYAWYHLGLCWQNLAMTMEGQSSAEAQPAKNQAEQCFKRVRELDPYFGPAIYQLGMSMREQDMSKAKSLLDEGEALKDAGWDSGPRKLRYSEMGRYAEVINPIQSETKIADREPLPLFQADPRFKVQLRPGTRWATASDFGKGASAELRSKIRNRFGGCLVVLDYNRDGKPDLFLLAAVEEDGKVHDLLLRNEGDGRFTDVTVEAGLGQSRPSLGCTVGDFDNDGFPDLFIIGIGEQHLFRNNRKGGFEDVSREAGLDQLKSVCLSASFVDLDQDGDLDLVVGQYAASPEKALALLAGSRPAAADTGPAIFLNIGEARPRIPSEDPPPLTVRFQRMQEPAALKQATGITGLAMTDVDCDRDLDLLLLADQATPKVVLNDRLLRFHGDSLPESLVPASRWNGALVLHARNNERPDLFLLPDGKSPLLLLNRCSGGKTPLDRNFERGMTNSPELLQAQAIDLDLDGRTDIVGLSAQHRPVLLYNDGQALVHVAEALGADTSWPSDLVAVSVADFNGDGFPDLVVWSESRGLEFRLSQKNRNHGLVLDLTGHRRVDIHGEPARTNADGVGAQVIVQVEDHRMVAENTTQCAGLGQSRCPVVVGLGRFTHPDVVRFRWPDNVWQAEFGLPADQLARVDETERKSTSCPVLFTWNGERFVFVTDFLGAGSMGELSPDGRTRPPRPEESVKIEAEELAPRDGQYLLKVAEPMDEVVYLDRLQLVVIDHPADAQVFPDERFVSSGPPSSQDLLVFRRQLFPCSARDHHGKDVTAILQSRDRKTVDDFARRNWLGYAEEHWVELDFQDRLAHFGPRDPLILCLAGWTDYPYPESIWAASQSGVSLLAPVLERLGSDGHWQTLDPDIGFPAGLPRMMTVDVTGKLGGPHCLLRLRTNTQIYWDQIFVAPLAERIPAAATNHRAGGPSKVRVQKLAVSRATLEARGCLQEYSPDGLLPTLYDYNRRASVPSMLVAGRLTRTGPVTELLREQDDRFVIFGPGDEITVGFDARPLPSLPSGWKRSFVLRTWGYSKDCGPFTATGATVEPLPFRAMSNYPYAPTEHYPDDAAHRNYRRQYNTREVGTR
jgi:tetratricopeptide (TPR) repeat protein